MSDLTGADFEQLSRTIKSGAAVCLVGAGFSTLAKQGSSDEFVPSTFGLTEEIKTLLGVDSGEPMTLSDAAELCEEDPADRLKLNQLIVQKLTSTRPSDDQRWLVNQNWRAIFTTNFDDVVENAFDKSGFFPVTPATDIGSVAKQKTPIYYLHGRALDLREQDKDPSLVISESNYLKMGERNKALYARLFNEILCARAVVLIGYSLKDLEIAKGFLFSSDTIRSKTFIVTGSTEKSLTTRRLEKFGHVLPIGLEGFRSSVAMAVTSDHSLPSYQYLREFSVILSEDNESSEITGDDFIKTVISGRLEPEKIAAQPHSKDTPYYVERSAALDQVASGNHQRYIVSSDFGNGKTSFLTEVAVRLFSQGRQVFYVETRLPDIFPEIDAVLSAGNPAAFLIDDVVRYRSVASYIGARLHNQSILVCTTRGDQDAQYEQIASELGGAHRFVELNSLSDGEIDDWNHLLERWGYWELRAELSDDDRRRFLVERCGRENRSIILSLFNDSRVAAKIDEIVSFFLKRHDKHIKAFCGLLISSLAQRHVSWESLVSWLSIDEQGLRDDLQKDDISFLFSRGRLWNFLTSAQLAEYILRNKFVANERDVLVEVYSSIVLKTAESSGDQRFGFDFKENLKELMKFRFLEKLFGESDASGILIPVYPLDPPLTPAAH